MQAEPVSTTKSPQSTEADPMVNEGSMFQQSAGMDALDKSRKLEVATMGQRIDRSDKHSAQSNSAAPLMVLVVVTILILVAMNVYFRRVVMRQGGTGGSVFPFLNGKQRGDNGKESVAAVAENGQGKTKFQRGKKKLSRAQRHR